MNEQHELYENARTRVQQKKRLYWHFILFVIGSIFLFITNKLLNIWETHNWYLWVSTGWFFLWVLHCVNVFITNPFMGKEWERSQTEKLVLKQELKIAKMEKDIAYETKLNTEGEQYDDDLKTKED